ncbi:MAG: hypothetical protein KBS79_04405, partial [Lachnospiraceae bacterium]|nr:hypothetical protein [Candidatus Minthocola equi]
MKTKKYVIGDKINRLKKLANGILIALLFLFYFIYQALFQAINLQNPTAYALVLIGIMGALAYFILKKFLAYYKNAVSYEVDDESVTLINGKIKRRFCWNEFAKADFDYAAMFTVAAVRFKLKDGKAFTVNKYIDGHMMLTYEILKHIEGIADMDKDLIS